MWVYLNEFKYDELLYTIIKEKHLEDEVISTEYLATLFKRVGKLLTQKNTWPTTEYNTFLDTLLEALHQTRNGLLSPDGQNTLSSFLGRLDKPFTLDDEFILPLSLVKEYCGFVEDESGWTIVISKDEIDNLGNTLDIKLGALTQPQPEHDDADLAIEQALRDLLYPEEHDPYLMWDLRVLDTPGKVVKYGDHLITFPTLFAIVRPQL